MGPAQKKYKAMLEADAAKKKAAAKKADKPAEKPKPKGIRGILAGRAAQIDAASGYAEGGRVKRKKKSCG